SSRTENSAHHTSNQYMYGANADVSIGWGRVRDATPVFSALLLEERLQRDHMLARTLSVDARNKLAALIAIEGDFAEVHDEPDKAFWSEVERIVREDGALTDGRFDAHAANHVREDLHVGRMSFYRQTGWFARLVVSGRHQDVVVRDDQS